MKKGVSEAKQSCRLDAVQVSSGLPELYSMALVIFRTSFYGVWMEKELVTKVHTMGGSLG